MELPQKKKFKKILDMSLGFALQPYIREKEGHRSVLCFILNKYYNGRIVSAMTLNKKELKNLKRFFAERRIK